MQGISLSERAIPVSASVLEIATTLIGFDTTSRNSNLPLIHWVGDFLRGYGVDSHLVYDETGRKANLFATIGNPSAPGLVLSGHTDVVPVDGQPWTTDPFKAIVRDGRLYGRGSADMKGYLACALAAVPLMLRQPSRRPFHLAFSYDEEVGCLGVRHLLADLGERGIRPAACIVGEPTMMKPVVAHKGRRQVRCCIHGKAAHSSQPQSGVSAIDVAARVLGTVAGLAEREAAQGLRDPGFDTPYATIQCGLVSGGNASNTVPADCELSLEVRRLPAHPPEALFDEVQALIDRELLPRMRARHPASSIELEVVADTPGHQIDEAAPIVALLKRLTGQQRVARVAYTTEAGLFQRSGIPTVVCGPGDIDQAHKPDEFIELAQLAACERMMGALIAEAAKEG